MQQFETLLGGTDDALSQDEPMQEATGGRRAPRAVAGTREYWAGQLMQPEWMIDVPEDLATSWYVMCRPEGQRCVLVAVGGSTVSRLRNGVQLHRFQSALPGGSGSTAGGGSDAITILDTVCQPETSTYYVIDLMCWKGVSYYDCSAEFRQYWLHAKLAELDSMSQQPHALQALPAYPFTSEGLRAAYDGPVPYQRDGLYLLHKEGHYALGLSPLALLWKDAACSRYFVDTDAAGNALPQQAVVLEYRMDRTVATADDPPVVLARMPADFVDRMGPRLKPGKLLRFAIEEAGIQIEDGVPVGAALKFDGAVHQRRGRADVWSKIAFQYQARRQPLTIAQLLAACAIG